MTVYEKKLIGLFLLLPRNTAFMGIKGTVKRSTDGDFIHANVDIDLIITEEPENWQYRKL